MFHILISWHEVDQCGFGDLHEGEFYEFHLSAVQVYGLREFIVHTFAAEDTKDAFTRTLQIITNETENER